jgi:hypothetical protein
MYTRRFVIYDVVQPWMKITTNEKIICEQALHPSSWSNRHFSRTRSCEAEEDICSIAIPYSFHVAFEKFYFRLDFNPDHNLITTERNWHKNRLWKICDFIYGWLICGYPMCCSLRYALRKNTHSQNHHENYSKCNACLKKEERF